MNDVKFDGMAAALTAPKFSIMGETLRIAEAPDPFVPPTFALRSGPPIGSCEVILVSASAAVGKSTLARALSAECRVPILDLAQVPVATGSLIGILSHFRGSTSPVDAFHNGEISILIDSLDEGRLKSGDSGLLSFIQTSGDFIRENNNCKRVKLVFFGRRDAIDYAELCLSEAGLVATILEVGYFQKDGARALIHAYAAKFATATSQYNNHHQPADELITTYFNKIAAALGLCDDKLWEDGAGRAFAGYAPVLAAVGLIISNIENFVEERNRLEQVGTESAWDVIESVLSSILLRDQEKLVGQLSQAGFRGSTAQAFSPLEQKALLLQRVQREQQRGTGRVNFAGSDGTKYLEQVQQWLPEHPFLHEGCRFTNDVIASYAMSTALVESWNITDLSLLAKLARQPFLWRSLKSIINTDTIIDGIYLGYILSSFWSDPLTLGEQVVVEDMDDGLGAFVKIIFSSDEKTFIASTPLHFYGQIRNVEMETSETIRMVGVGDGASQVFYVGGDNRIKGGIIDLRASELRLRKGSLWLDAEVIPYGGQLSIVVDEGATYRWSERLASTYPFSSYQNTIDAGNSAVQDLLSEVLGACARRSPGTSITSFADFSFAEGDYLGSIYAKYNDGLREVISGIVRHGFASTAQIQASGQQPKIKVRLMKPFAELRDAAMMGTPDSDLSACLADIRLRLEKRS